MDLPSFILVFFSPFECTCDSQSIISNRSVKMYTSRKKIHKDKDAEPSEFEESVAQVLLLFAKPNLLVVHLGILVLTTF